MSDELFFEEDESTEELMEKFDEAVRKGNTTIIELHNTKRYLISTVDFQEEEEYTWMLLTDEQAAAIRTLATYTAMSIQSEDEVRSASRHIIWQAEHAQSLYVGEEESWRD